MKAPFDKRDDSVKKRKKEEKEENKVNKLETKHT